MQKYAIFGSNFDANAQAGQQLVSRHRDEDHVNFYVAFAEALVDEGFKCLEQVIGQAFFAATIQIVPTHAVDRQNTDHTLGLHLIQIADPLLGINVETYLRFSSPEVIWRPSVEFAAEVDFDS